MFGLYVIPTHAETGLALAGLTEPTPMVLHSLVIITIKFNIAMYRNHSVNIRAVLLKS